MKVSLKHCSLDTMEGKFGTGCILRDHRGWVIASEILVRNSGFSPPLAEAYAILGGLRLAEELGFHRLTVHSDCLEVVRAIRCEAIPVTELGTILEDIKVRRLAFSNFDIHFIPRSYNVAAHNMAKYALRVNSDTRWMGLVPPCAMREVLNDLSC